MLSCTSLFWRCILNKRLSRRLAINYVDIGEKIAPLAVLRPSSCYFFLFFFLETIKNQNDITYALKCTVHCARGRQKRR